MTRDSNPPEPRPSNDGVPSPAEVEPDGTTEEARTVSRRSLLAGAAAVAGTALTAGAARGLGVQEATDPTRVPGDRPQLVGSRSPHETPEKLLSGSAGGSSRTPFHELHGTLTPADLHFERHHHGIPEIDPAAYRLLIHGMVDRPTVFTIEDLKRFPEISKLLFIECSGNGGASYSENPNPHLSPQALDGLLSTSEWSGVALSTLFEEVGASPDATWFLAEGSDAAVMTRSIPIEKAWDDAMIAYGQNGEAIRPEQGYPARLLNPGWEGNSSVKWLRRIELSDRPFMTREETSKYSDPLPEGRVRMFSFVMDAKSTITHPTYPSRLDGPGFVEISGYAWTGRGIIERVEVSTDGGDTWEDAELSQPVLPKCTVRFRYPWTWDGEPAYIMSRATDETGYRQPVRQQVVDVRGPGTRYHYNTIRGWRILGDGSIEFAPL